jgi:hypothetical protein
LVSPRGAGAGETGGLPFGGEDPTLGAMSEDKVVALRPWDAAVKSAEARAANLLERADADQVIRGLTELEVYHAAKTLGVDEAGPLLLVLEPEQIRALIDLDVWRRDRIDLPDLLVWLGAFQELSVERLAAAAEALDPELLALLFRRRLWIARRAPEDQGEVLPAWAQDPPEEILPLIDTPDRRFILAARVQDLDEELGGGRARLDEEERKAVLALVDALYRSANFEHAAAVLRMAETDASADLEETAYRFQQARLEDLGFPAVARAQEVYAELDPRTVEPFPWRPAPTELRLPALYARRLSDGLFEEALRAIDDPQLVRAIEAELLPLCNAVLVADRIDPADTERIAEVLLRIRATLELALTTGAGDDRLAAARARLEQVPIRSLFSMGWTITLRLKTRARALLDRPLASTLEEPDRAVLDGLALRRPLLHPAVEGAAGSGLRPIASPEDVARLEDKLAELEVIDRLLETHRLHAFSAALDPGVEPPRAERTADTLLLTWLAARQLGREVGPLDRHALLALAQKMPPDPPLPILAALGEPIRGLPPALAARLGRRWRELAEALAPFSGASQIDPRFIGGVVRRVD